MNSLIKLITFLSLLSLISPAFAALSAGSSVLLNGVTHNTFIDSVTGNIWLNQEKTYNLKKIEQTALIDNTDFHWATSTDVSNLFEPLMDGTQLNWDNTIGAIVEAGTDPDYRAGRTGADGAFELTSSATAPIYNAAILRGTRYDTVGMWAFKDAPVIATPTPSTTALLFLGSIALLASFRRRIIQA